MSSWLTASRALVALALAPTLAFAFPDASSSHADVKKSQPGAIVEAARSNLILGPLEAVSTTDGR